MKDGYATAIEHVEAGGLSVAIVASRFNTELVDRLIDGSVGALTDRGADRGAISVRRVPGAFEVPVVADQVARRGRADLLVALAVVIRGQTPHFDYICQAATLGLEAVARDAGIPVGFGILTCDTREQAIARAGGTHGNKGVEAALSAVATARLLEQV